MVTFNALVNNFFTEYFRNTNIAGIGKSLIQQDFHIYGYYKYVCHVCAWVHQITSILRTLTETVHNNILDVAMETLTLSGVSI
jgi:hypothetical protein